MAGLAAAGVGVRALGDIYEGEEALRSGEASRAAHEFNARQLEVNAGQSIAASQRAAAEQRRAAELVQSRTLAVAAASGAGASDATVLNLMARQAGEGAYRASVALYEGEESARKMRARAAGERYEGEVAERAGRARRRAARIRAFGGILQGGGMLSQYGGGGFNSGSSAPDTSGNDWT